MQKEKEEPEQEIKFLRGKAGEKGEQGEIGPEGPRGPQGYHGFSGDNGKDGKDGVDGKPGTKGERGERGFNGENGKDAELSLEAIEAAVLPLIPDIPEVTPKEIVEKINKGKDKIKASKIDGFDELEGLAKSANKNVQNVLSLGGSRQTAIKVSGTLLGTGINTINFVGATGTKVGDGSEVNVTTSGSGSGVVQTIVAGTGITVNSTDPANPIVSATGTGTPGGSTTQLQYNNAGAFGGISRVTTNGNDLILTGQASPTYTQGKLVYDTDNESLTFFNNDSNISLQIGQEQWLKVINKTGSTIANGAAVYINGVDATTGLQTIGLAKGDGSTTIIGAGLTTESIANNAIGYVTAIGVVHGLDTSGFSAGATVFISATTAGALTSTAPTAPNYRYRIGIVGVSSATVGTINVTPSTAALGNGTANQVFGMNNAGTAQEVKSIVAGTGITVTNTANTITIAATGGGTGTVTSVTSADANATVANTTTTPVITIVSAPKLATARTIGTVTGDATSAGSTFDGTANNTNALTFATVNANVGSFGSATAAPSFTVNGKGLITAAGTNTITPAVGSITGLGTGVATFLATPSSANLATAVTDETGSGALVFGTSPTLTTAVLGSSTATTQSPSDNSTKIATTAYVDAAVLGQNFKEAAKYATTAALATVVYSNGSSGVGATLTAVGVGALSLDGNTPSVNDRILVKNQVSTFQNGIYTVTVVGTGATVFVLTRSTDANTTGEFKTGDFIFVTSGTANANTTWAYTGIDSPVIGTDAITYAQSSGQGTVTSGNGITVTGLSVAIDTSVTVDKTTVQTLTNKTLTSPTLTTPVINGTPTGTGVSSSSTAGTLMLRDTNSNTAIDNLFLGYQTVTTAAGTTGFSADTVYQTYFTGSTTQTVSLPTASSMVLGQQYNLVNNSTGAVTVQSSGANTILVMAGGTTATFTCILTSGTTAASWSFWYAADVVASGKKLNVSNSLTLAGTDATTMTFPTTSATLARTDAAQTFLGVQTFNASPVLSSNTITVGGNANTLQAVADTFVYRATTDTLTNKRITRRAVTVNAPGASPTTVTDNVDIQIFTGLAANITSMTTNLSGTANNGDMVEFQFVDNGTARTIAWGTSFVNGGLVNLPTTTVINTMLRVLVEWQTTTSTAPVTSTNKWVCIAVA